MRQSSGRTARLLASAALLGCVALTAAGCVTTGSNSGALGQTTTTYVDETQVDESTDVAERKEQLDSDIDAILDDIDDVLESNSEDFVRSFVQKGGQ